MKTTKTTILILNSLFGVATLTVLNAAVLTNVPMQGPMVHVSIAYDSAQSRVAAHVEEVVPELRPLDVSNPGDCFTAGDPWDLCLDPAQQGLAFNRQYGFVPDALTDPLPEGTAIWIRNMSLTPGIAAYRYRSTDPKAWEPMFGNQGSSPVWQWNMSMFHPAMVAAPVQGTHSGVFEAFLVNVQTGAPVAGVASASFTLNWTVAASSRPVLGVAPKVHITWALTATNYVLQTASSLNLATWDAVTNTPVVMDGQNTVILPPAAANRFFRLVRVP